MANFTYENHDHNSLYQETYTASGAPIKMVYLPHGFTVQLTPTGGSANISASNDGTNWISWDAGDVTISTISMLQPVRYVKVTLVTATACDLTMWGF
jgi:hypothetical protein